MIEVFDSGAGVAGHGGSGLWACGDAGGGYISWHAHTPCTHAMHAYARTHTHTHAHAHIHAHTYTRTHTYMYTHIHSPFPTPPPPPPPSKPHTQVCAARLAMDEWRKGEALIYCAQGRQRLGCANLVLCVCVRVCACVCVCVCARARASARACLRYRYTIYIQYSVHIIHLVNNAYRCFPYVCL